MKYKGKYRAYIGLIIHNDVHKAEYIQLGTMTPKEAQQMRPLWKNSGFDWIIWRKPEKYEIKEAMKPIERLFDYIERRVIK